MPDTIPEISRASSTRTLRHAVTLLSAWMDLIPDHGCPDPDGDPAALRLSEMRMETVDVVRELLRIVSPRTRVK
jgi:hypothetical protein